MQYLYPVIHLCIYNFSSFVDSPQLNIALSTSYWVIHTKYQWLEDLSPLRPTSLITISFPFLPLMFCFKVEVSDMSSVIVDSATVAKSSSLMTSTVSPTLVSPSVGPATASCQMDNFLMKTTNSKIIKTYSSSIHFTALIKQNGWSLTWRAARLAGSVNTKIEPLPLLSSSRLPSVPWSSCSTESAAVSPVMTPFSSTVGIRMQSSCMVSWVLRRDPGMICNARVVINS